MEKPKVKFTGKDGNVFSLLSVANRALKKAKQGKKIKKLSGRIMAAKSYEEALGIMAEYVDVY